MLPQKMTFHHQSSSLWLMQLLVMKLYPSWMDHRGATYQRAMQKIFDDMLRKNVKCYVDDLVVKSRKSKDHLQDLCRVFDRLRTYQLKMNPLKCAFGVTSGKFLGFIVQHRGIEVDLSKIVAIRDMPEPRNLQELRSLQGRLAFIRRFVSILAGRWKPLILYIVAQECSLRALLAQENEENKERALYYLS
ncbi:Retrovirus-related Pol polyprotein from transposon 17.6 [Vitis vinifera]|uniref:Retrovirus-related Pol polyprotein from transposon 17.6 n=1 Tax=Vitis vinifera TaxID=29760 RepID=A0A438HUX4_VITVI|nr:Retrovirus-related Pol polyprotein from transposon 17.6 [Vitis vinifera]